MTNQELAELLSNCPTLYHMAERGSWPSIQQYGLLSTTALLDLHSVGGCERANFECSRRLGAVELSSAGLPRAVLRDQMPINDGALRRSLPAHMSPSDWYKILNEKVFFWLTRDRLVSLLNAVTNRQRTHDVLQIDTKDLVENYRKRIHLSPINSGAVHNGNPAPRDQHTFRRIEDYPYAERRRINRQYPVVELAVDYSVPDVDKYVRRVVTMRGDEELETLFNR